MTEPSNEVLKVMLEGFIKQSNERHVESVRRLDGILEQTTLTNGRLRNAESTIAQHGWALAALGGIGLVWLGVWLAKVL